MGNLNMLKERNPQACLTKGSYAWCHTRWCGLESHLLTAYSMAVLLLVYIFLRISHKLDVCKNMYDVKNI